MVWGTRSSSAADDLPWMREAIFFAYFLELG